MVCVTKRTHNKVGVQDIKYLCPMQALKLKATLRDSDPLVWRTLYFHPESGLEQLSDMLLIALGWDEENEPFFITNDGPITPEDDAWHDASLNEYFLKHGDLMSYSKESADEYHLELELLAIVEASDDGHLPRIDAGENQAPPEDIGGLESYTHHLEAIADKGHPGNEAAASLLGDDFDPTFFDVEALNEEARDLFDGDFSGLDIDFDANDDDENEPHGNFTDVDAGKEIPFEYDWLAAEHGIKVTEDDVRGTPQELIDFRADLNEDDLGSPRNYRKLIEPLFKKYPDDPLLNLEMAGLYAMTGEGAKSRRIARDLDAKFPDNLELLVNKLLSFEDEDEFMAETEQLPHPLDIRNHPAGKDGFYHTTELLAFEEVAIREAVIREDLTEARSRLDRLVRFGFLHGDVEQSAMATAALMMADIQYRIQDSKLNPSAPWPDSFNEVSERTNAILEASMKEVATMMKEYEEQDALPPTFQREGPKVGRNDPCTCGSGKKYKQCCLRK